MTNHALRLHGRDDHAPLFRAPARQRALKTYKLKTPKMPDLDPPHRPLLRRLLLPLLILVVLCAAAYASYWAYGKLKGRQSRHLTKMATEYLQKNKVAEAEMSLETAVRLKPNNAEALRVLARLQGAMGKGAQSLETWQKLAASGGITLDDLAQYSMAASREGDQALAERLANAAATGGNTVLKHVLRGNLLLSKNDIPGAEAEFRQAVEVDTTGNSRAMLARFLLTRRLNTETAPEIREMLREISKRPDAAGLEALSTAITRGLVLPAELPVWVSALRLHPKSTAQALLLADATDIQLQPETKPAVLAKMLERMQGASLEDRARGLQFLLRMEEPAQAASLLTRDEALKKRETLSLWLDVQSLTKNWPAVLDALSQPNLPLAGHLTKLYRGRALVMSGKEVEGRAAFAEALQETAGSKAEFLETLAYLNLAGEDQLFDQGLQRALSNPETAKESFLRILPSVAARRDSALDFCGLAVLVDAWKSLNLDLLLAGIGTPRQRALLKAMVFARLLFPCSKLALKDAAQGTLLAAACGLPADEDFDEDDLYAAMDSLTGHWCALEKKLAAETFKTPVSLALYDLTSVYFEGSGPAPLARYGHSRDHRSDRPQIIPAVATDTHGTPLHICILRGNRADSTTLRSTVKILRRRFQIPDAVFVFDGGMSSKINLQSFEDEGLEFVTRLSNSTLEALLKDLPS